MNCDDLHSVRAAQVRSAVAVTSLVWYSVSEQPVVVAHSRSADSVAATVSYSSGKAQVVSAAHVRSVRSVGALVSYCSPSVHVVVVVQVRSLLLVAAVEMNSISVQGVMAVHSRLADVVNSLLMY